MNAGLRSGIVDLTILACLSVDGPDIHDPSEVAAKHPFPDGFAHVETPAQIDVEHFIPMCTVHFAHCRVARNAGVVYEYVDRTGFLREPHHCVGTLLEVSDVTLERLNSGFLRKGTGAIF